uniref:Uncharacterized protein n=1 Tax=Oryza brachyantha TaxID=4533 RepID=J3MU01_ORYBR
MTIQSETILLSRCNYLFNLYVFSILLLNSIVVTICFLFLRCPFSSLFADPAKFHREKSCSKEGICPCLTNASFAKHNHLSLVGEVSSRKLPLSSENS